MHGIRKRISPSPAKGRCSAELENLRDELGLQDKVTFAGFLNGPDLCALYPTVRTSSCIPAA